jgi:imidazolonepropionase-like amidohydrolase
MGLVWVVRKSFSDAQIFDRGETPATRGEGSPSDASIPYLIDILHGELPFRVQARSQLDILTAIRLSREFNFKFVLEEGTDASRCIDELKANDTPVIFGPIFDTPTGFRRFTDETGRFRYSTPKRLVDGGIKMALSAGDLTGEGALPMQAGYAMRLGLTRAQALAAVTTIPAELLGIGDLAGTLETGGDFVVWSGEPFEATTRAEMVFIVGRLVSDRTKEE